MKRKPGVHVHSGHSRVRVIFAAHVMDQARRNTLRPFALTTSIPVAGKRARGRPVDRRLQNALRARLGA